MDYICYDTASINLEKFANINIQDSFFDSFRKDYAGFNDWFLSKSENKAFTYKDEHQNLGAFLFLKIEEQSEPYADITPTFNPKLRLKIGTFKVSKNGTRLGERFIKIIFDHAIANKVDEIYVTIFNNTEDQIHLTHTLCSFGFKKYGTKSSKSGKEYVYTRSLERIIDPIPANSYPYFSKSNSVFINPIYPVYHTELLPDSYLKSEDCESFQENKAHYNAIKKVYISRSFERNLHPGDVIIFYRTSDSRGPAAYRSVITTIGIVENIHTDIKSFDVFCEYCNNRSIFTKNELLKHWDYNKSSRPFIVKFLCVYSFPKRINRAKLIELGIMEPTGGPRGFTKISKTQFEIILKETNSNESLVVN